MSAGQARQPPAPKFGGHIALTGGIGSGKSSAAAFLAGLGWPLLDADQIGRQLLAPEQAGWRALREAFGARYFAADRTLDRARLRRELFADAELRQGVNTLLHPLIRAELLRQLECGSAAGARHLIEVALLYESGWADDFGAVVVVFAPEEACLARVMARDGVSRAEALAAVAAQLPLADKTGRADRLIDNSGSWADTCRQLTELDHLLGSKWLAGEKSIDRRRIKK